MAQKMRVDPSAYRALPLRVHSLLRAVSPHDVWRIRLVGAAPETSAKEFLESFSKLENTGLSRRVRALFRVRSALGRVLRWDDDPVATRDSYVTRLSAEDRARSLEEPGAMVGPFRLVYLFEREALVEVINRTVHALLSFAVVPGHRECFVYWGVYVESVSPLTPLYMALIDPFRRLVVYPDMIRRLETAWIADRSERSSRGIGPPQGGD